MILHKDHIINNYISLVKCPVVIGYQNPVVNQVGGFTDYSIFFGHTQIFLPILVEVMIPSEYCLSRDLNPLPGSNR